MTDEVLTNASPEQPETPELGEGAIEKVRSAKKGSGRTREPRGKQSNLRQLEFGFASTARTAQEALALFTPADPRDDPEAVKSFSTLVTALCRLGQATLNAQEYRDGLEFGMESEKKRGKGLPEALVKVCHEQLKLL